MSSDFICKNRMYLYNHVLFIFIVIITIYTFCFSMVVSDSDSDSLFSNPKYVHNLLYIYKHVHQYWIHLLYVHIMVAEVSHSSRLSTCDTSVNIMHIM